MTYSYEQPLSIRLGKAKDAVEHAAALAGTSIRIYAQDAVKEKAKRDIAKAHRDNIEELKELLSYE